MIEADTPAAVDGDAKGVTNTESRGPDPGDDLALDIFRNLAQAWALFKTEPVTHMVAGLIVMGLGGLTAGILLPPLLVGYIRLCDRQRVGESLRVGQIWEGMQRFAPALVAGFLIAIGVSLGTFLFLIPGVVLSILWSFTLHHVALTTLSPLAAMQASWRLVSRHPGPILLALLTILGIVFAGSIVIVGLVVATPLALIFMTLCFHELGD